MCCGEGQSIMGRGEEVHSMRSLQCLSAVTKMAETVALKSKTLFDAGMHRRTNCTMYRLYTAYCSSPLPKYRGWRFKDGYQNPNMEMRRGSPGKDWHTYFDFSFTPDVADEQTGWSVYGMLQLPNYFVVHCWGNGNDL